MKLVPETKADALAVILASKRTAVGMSQESAAEKMGITQDHLSRLETGQRPIKAQVLFNAADVYGCEAYVLVMEAEEYWNSHREHRERETRTWET